MAKKVDEGVTLDVPVSESVETEPVSDTFEELFAEASLPFDKTHQRQGPGGRMLDYITGEQALGRMQSVYGDYAWTVTDVKVLGDSIVVIGTLTVKVGGKGHEWISRDGVGSAQFGGRNDASMAAKTAETNAVKRAAAKFGVGLYLYNKDEADELPGFSPPSQANFTRPPVQFSANNSTGEGTTGVIEQVSRPSTGPDGKQRLGGVKLNGQWYNVSSYTPIDLSGLQPGQAVTIAHAPGKTFINGITPAGAAVGASEDEAF